MEPTHMRCSAPWEQADHATPKINKITLNFNLLGWQEQHCPTNLYTPTSPLFLPKIGKETKEGCKKVSFHWPLFFSFSLPTWSQGISMGIAPVIKTESSFFSWEGKALKEAVVENGKVHLMALLQLSIAFPLGQTLTTTTAMALDPPKDGSSLFRVVGAALML